MKGVMRLQEEITQKVIRFTTKGAKLSEEILKKVIQLALREMKKRRETPQIGRNSLKRLSGRNGDIKMIEVSKSLPEFEKIAKEYKIRYSIKRGIDGESGKTRWQVFFKSNQEDALTAAFGKYTRSILKTKKKEKPSLLSALRKNIETVRNQAKQDPERNRGIGGKER